MKAPVSVCLIVRDEAENLPGCLASIVDICEDVVVVDTGSRDGTAALAERLGARVFHFTWIDDFSAARNFAASHASQPYILRLDADERLAEGAREALLDYCRVPGQVAGRATLTNLLDNGETTSEYLTCLYPNTPAYRYERRIHEQLRCNGGTPGTVATSLVILHTGYTSQVIAQRSKGERNLRLLERDLAESPADAYVHYQIGRTRYAMQEYAAAVASYQNALELLANCEIDGLTYVPMIFLQLAYAHTYLRDLKSALATIAQGVQLYADFTDLYFVYGVALMQLGGAESVREMIAAFEHCLRMGEADTSRYSTVAGVGTFRALHNLGAFREAVGDADGAREYYRRASQYGFEPSLQRLRAL